MHEHYILAHLSANANFEEENVNKKEHCVERKSQLILYPHNWFCCTYVYVFSNKDIQVECCDIFKSFW
jgi:hypothetical protein